MLDTDTKRRIDTARDILVGKVPDPKSQVEQITIALIYKFMDDIDVESEEFGGKRSFFAGEYARYGWAKLMRSGLGGHETLNLYAEAIATMPENPGIPALFRDIFKNAYLPYRDPETLRAFLKTIDEFTYDHSERLGDAFEYLLSVLGSQGDAGQFRTPRHIIDFIVGILEPKKGETVLDPACGTAGFLISSYKHILAANTDPQGASTLTPDDKGRLAANFKGYDISPDMVRLSLVNMYLHGFTDPHIFEYDTLTSEEHWNEYADVILANPPFMSPKGGIRPHNRFSVQSKRSEVLFVDYMAEHLMPSGRAGIIVPEGIIFQIQNAYKQLRKMLVEGYLVAVVSLPAGVFNPYSGVKTSILILDKSLAQKTGRCAFFKVENDGFDLGAQRRPIDKNDLPQVQCEIAEYLHLLRTREMLEDFQPALGLIVEKEKIATNGEYNLSGERYRTEHFVKSEWPSMRVGDVFNKAEGTVLPMSLRGPVNYVGLENITQTSGQLSGNVSTDKPAEIKSLKNAFCPGDILYGKLRPNLNKVWLSDRKGICSTDIFVVRSLDERALPALYAYVFRSGHFNSAVLKQLKGAQLPRIGWQSFANLEIPLPPLEVQEEIAAEIEGYQKVIDGARAVVDNYRPHIAVDPDWPMVEIGDVCVINPNTLNPKDLYPDSHFNYIDISCVENETGLFLGANKIASADAPIRARRPVERDDVLVSTVRPNLRAFAILTEIPHRAVASTGFAVIQPKDDSLLSQFLIHMIRNEMSVAQMVRMMDKGSYPSINQADVESIQIPLPPLEVQQAIVTEIKAEQAIVAANRELIERFEKKIQDTLARVWGDAEPDTAEA